MLRSLKRGTSACTHTALSRGTIWGTGFKSALEDAAFEVRFEKSELAAEGIFAGDCFIATKPQGEADGNHPRAPSAW
jgi:hypothetical protein